MPKVLITIDTELGELGKDMPGAFELFIEGRLYGKEVGTHLIMKFLEKYNAKGEFFLDVYPDTREYQKKASLLCESVLKLGHTIQLHTHPSTAFSQNRIHMQQYSLKEQIEILEYGKERIKKWTGKYPIAHRAGGYGINEDTLKALNEVGIYYDSSYFYQNSNCKYKTDVINKSFMHESVCEIPVTVYKKSLELKLFGKPVLSKENYQKLDFRYGAEIEDIVEVVKSSRDEDIIVLFLHSFNFLDLQYNFKTKRFGNISIRDDLIRKFDMLLNSLAGTGKCNFVSFDKLRVEKNCNEYVHKITKKINILSVLGKKAIDKKNMLFGTLSV